MIIGHDKITGFFEEAIKGGRLSHAHCFVGPDGVGKRKMAINLAAKLLETNEEKLANHPDFYYLERGEDEKTGKLKKDISIEQTRALRDRLGNRSWQGGNQVVIVDEAELLGASANSILKILEEPPAKTFLFLLTNDEAELLPTIRSRCQLVFFHLTGEEEIKGGLKKMGYADLDLERITAAAWGRPGRALEFAADAEGLQKYYDELDRLKKIIGLPFYEKLKATEELFGDKTDPQRDRKRLRGILDIWLVEWEKRLKEKDSANSAVAKKKIVGVIDGILEAKKMMGENIHPRLLVEEVLLNF